MMKALLRTRVPNSVWATMNVFPMMSAGGGAHELLSGAVRLGDTDENVLERRTRQHEVVDLAGLGEVPQEFLRISLQAYFLDLAEVVDRFHLRKSGQRGGAERR